MKEKDLKLGIFSWFGFVMPIQERLKLIKKVGFDAVSIWWEDEQGDKIIKKEHFPRMVEDYGLTIENIHAPFGNCNMFWSEDQKGRLEVVKNHIKIVEECNKFNIPLMVMHISEEFDIDDVNKNGLESLKDIIKSAEENDVKIAIENTDSNFFIDYLLSNILSSNLGLCFDTSHNILGRNSDINLLNKYGDRLFAIHISDNDGLKDRHWIPYEGNIDWSKFKNSFPKDYNGYLSLEVFRKEEDVDSGPKEFLKKAYDTICTLKKYLLT